MRKQPSREFDGDGMSLEEIAQEMGISYSQVRYILFRAMQKLRMKTVARELKAEDFYDTTRSENRRWEH